MNRTLALTLACLVLLAGCAPTRQERLAELNKLVGKNEAEVVSALGVPTRTYEANGIRFVAYDERRLGLAPATVAGGPWGGPWGGAWGGPWGGGPWGTYGWYGGGFVGYPVTVERICETTFELAGGVVRAVALHGPGCGV